jgi:SNF2 family DNA or RNA helicase
VKTFGTVKHYDSQGLGAYWTVQCEPHVAIRIKRVFPRANHHRRGQIVLTDTPEVARDLEWFLGRFPMEIDERSTSRLDTQANQHRLTEESMERILSGERLPFELEPAREPRDYQVQAADLCSTTGRLLCADDLGLGKSFAGLLLLRNPDALPALVVCQAHLPEQWLDELEASFPTLLGHVIRTTKVYDPVEKRGVDRDPDVLISTYHKLDGWRNHLAGRIRTIIFDECQELRRADSAKYAAAGHIADEATYRMGLTATPVYNYGGEIHNIFQIIAPDELGSRGEFEREWGLAMRSGHLGVREPSALGHYLRDQGLMLRRTRREVQRELPEVVRVVHSIDSDEEVVDELTGKAIDLARLIVSSPNRKQVWEASGRFDAEMRQATGIAKAPYVADFVKMLLESEEPVVLFGWHREVYDIWGGRLEEHNPILYTGSESPRQKQRAKASFLEGHSNLLIMSLRSGAGLDGLQERAHVAVFGELDWSPGIHDQCIGRLHRDGQDESVVSYFLVSDQGADPLMAQVLNLKRQQGEQIRDPDVEVLQAADTTGDRVRRLAEDFLRKQGDLESHAALEAAA